MYKDRCIGTRRADLILRTSDGDAIVEMKAVGNLTSEHVKQLEYYMVHFDIDVGYLINFPHESGFPAVDSLEFAFQQTHISGPSALNHPISDATMRRRTNVSNCSSPHIIKLTKVLAPTTPAMATPPPSEERVTSRSSSVSAPTDIPTASKAYFGIAASTGKPCVICIRKNGYCAKHVSQDPNRE